MTGHKIGIWMYQNGGGSRIQQKMINKLRERDIEAMTHLDLSRATAKQGSIYCNGQDLAQLELFFSYNAGQQSPYQVYLYQTLNTMMPMINNYDAFALTEDKFRTVHKLKQSGVSSSDYIVCNRDNIDQVREQLRLWRGKAICKPVNGWGGNGVIRLEHERDLNLIQPFIESQPNVPFYLERVIDNDFTDYRVDIVDGKYVACYGRKAAPGQWKTNVTSGGHVILREAEPEIIELAQRACFVTGLEIAGVDIIYDLEKQQYVVLEVNGIPAFATPDQEAIGLDFNDKKIDYIVDLIDRTVSQKAPHFASSISSISTNYINKSSTPDNKEFAL